MIWEQVFIVRCLRAVDIRAVGILTQGTRSSGAVFRRVLSGGVRAVEILTQGTRSSGAVFRRISSGGGSKQTTFFNYFIMQLKQSLIEEIRGIINSSRAKAIRSVDNERVLMYWQIGKVIFEEEQKGKSRADYGSYLIKSISDEFQPHFGTGFTIRQLEMNRQFYRSFQNTNALRSQFSWTHYRTLIRIDNQDKRAFYIAETDKNNWTA